jgi:hypothetical protein
MEWTWLESFWCLLLALLVGFFFFIHKEIPELSLRLPCFCNDILFFFCLFVAHHLGLDFFLYCSFLIILAFLLSCSAPQNQNLME